ncbi:carbon storage regulator CsrA [Sanguibacter sp. 4.1]|uniref:Translational regulator CsrA n=1 Tax=Sanguibacter biliveldensis TaxID=3030830 RepID=A0AAF0Z2N1_9MICO|nr:carbon storage regulator CsrA [Sanguibacter sp. 4.1]WPF81732.1 carbon storage regulator CsrA [Sanguibacter sp. 4.1]
MLVLSRRVGEKLLIGDDIVITIIDTRGDGVRIGIDAPRSMRVNRAEVVEAVQASNLAAVAADDDAQAALIALITQATQSGQSTQAPDASTPETTPDEGPSPA